MHSSPRPTQPDNQPISEYHEECRELSRLIAKRAPKGAKSPSQFDLRHTASRFRFLLQFGSGVSIGVEVLGRTGQHAAKRLMRENPDAKVFPLRHGEPWPFIQDIGHGGRMAACGC